MSRVVDERVVAMQFDNSDFEKNVDESINTLGNLKTAIDNTSEKAPQSFNKLTAALAGLGGIGLGLVINKINSVAQNFINMASIGVGAIDAIGNAALRAASSIFSMISSSVVQGGISRAMNIENAKFMLEGLGVAWKDISEDIEYGVKDTAYGLDAAAKVASNLVASSVALGDPMKTALRAISGVAAMTNSTYEDIGDIFTSIAGNNKLMTQNLYSFSSRGLNAAAILGKELGKTEQEIHEMVSKGKIDFETFAAAMDSAFGEHAKEGNKTFQGALSNMKSALARIGAVVAEGGIQGLIPVFNGFRMIFNDIKAVMLPGLEELAKIVKTFFSDFGRSLEIFDSWIKLVRNADTAFLNFSKLFGRVITFINDSFKNTFTKGRFRVTIQELVDKINDLSEALLNNGNIQKTIGRIFDAVFGTIAKFPKIFIRVVDLFIQAFTTIDHIGMGIKKVYDNFFDYDVIEEFVNILINALDTLTGTIKDLDEAGDTTEKIAKTFEGLCAVVDMVKDAFTAFNEELLPVILNEKLSENVWLDLAKSLGDFFIKLRDAEKESGFFNKTFSTIAEVMKNVRHAFDYSRESIGKIVTSIKTFVENGGSLKDIFNNIKEAMSPFLTVLESLVRPFAAFGKGLLDNFIDKIKKIIELFKKSKLEPFINSVKENLKEIAKAAIPFLMVVGDKVTEFSVNMSHVLTDMAKNLDFSKIAILLADFNLLTFLDKLYWNINRFVSLFSRTAYDMYTRGGILENIVLYLKGITKDVKYQALTKMAISVALLAGSIFLLSMIDYDKLAIGAFIVANLFGEVAGAAAGIMNLEGKGNVFGAYAVSELLIAMAASIAILAAALYVLKDIDTKTLVDSTAALSVLFGELVGMFAVISNLRFTTIIDKAMAAVLLATSVVVLAVAMETISDIPFTSLIKAIAGLSVVMAEFTFLMSIIDTSVSASSAAGVMIIAGSVLMLGTTIKKLADLETGKMWQAILGIGAMMSSFTLMASLMPSGRSFSKSAAGILIIASAIDVMSIGIRNLGKMDYTELATSMTAVGALLIMFTGLSAIMKDSSSMVGFGAGITIMATAILEMAGAFKLLNDLDMKNLAISATIITAMFAIFSGVVTGMNKLGSGGFNSAGISVAFSVFAAAIIELAGALKMMSELDTDRMFTSLIPIMALLAVFIIAIYGVTYGGEELIPILWAVSGAFALFGLACSLAGIGLLAISVGIGALIVALTALASSSILLAVSNLVAAIVLIIDQFFNDILVAISNGLASSSELLTDALIKIIQMLLDALQACLPQLLFIVDKVMLALTEMLADVTESLFNSLAEKVLPALFEKLLPVVLDMLLKWVPAITKNALQVLEAINQLLLEYLPMFVGESVELLFYAIEKLEEVAPQLIAQSIEVLAYITMAIISGIVGLIPSMARATILAVEHVMDDIIKLLAEMKGPFMDKTVELINAICDVLETEADPLIEAYTRLLNDIIDITVKVFTSVATTTKLATAGEQIINGLVKGFVDQAPQMFKTVMNVGKTISSTFKRVMGIASPSKVFEGFGAYIMQGLGIGIEDAGWEPKEAMSTISQDLISYFKDKMKDVNFSDILGDENLNPVISPVLDLSNVESGMGSLSSMFGNQQITAIQGGAGGFASVPAMGSDISSMKNFMDKLNTKVDNLAAIRSEQVSNPTPNVNVVLEGDVNKMFKAIVDKNTKTTNATGYNPMTRQKG